MTNKYPFIKDNICPDEKKQLEALAKLDGKSLSSYVKQFLPIYANTFPLSVSDGKIQATGERKNDIHFLASDEELEKIRQHAKNMPIAEYIRSLALSGPHPVIINVDDSDISIIAGEIIPRLNRMANIIEAMQLQGFLKEEQYAALSAILKDVLSEVKNIMSETEKFRKSLRKEAMRIVRKRINSALKKRHEK